ncbi:divalent-cation tolerance protein CutA [Halomarina ordinaria]|uniref:Divalent-cation tolerance protein CutA n=1 Tax=Halomarina ordinaria TaxID=3033939 RepID=A0ABD5U8G3_9EURY|nr:divalent-cation tolerance protein CutA [Halomarina sp. PSRA2]
MPTVYVTAPTDAAEAIASALVEEGLAACVNAVPCSSTYRWRGDVVRDEEVILLAKTTTERYDALEARVVDLHPYEVPCVERFDEAAELDAFAAWRTESVR